MQGGDKNKKKDPKQDDKDDDDDDKQVDPKKAKDPKAKPQDKDDDDDPKDKGTKAKTKDPKDPKDPKAKPKDDDDDDDDKNDPKAKGGKDKDPKAKPQDDKDTKDRKASQDPKAPRDPKGKGTKEDADDDDDDATKNKDSKVKDPKAPKGQPEEEQKRQDGGGKGSQQSIGDGIIGQTRNNSIHESRASYASIAPWKTYDFLFPGGRLAKLVKIDDNSTKTIPLGDILARLKLSEGYPVVNLIGARDTNRGKFYGGIARACFNTDAVIVDNAIGTGVEKFALRRGVKLIGVAPENDIKYPKLNPTYVDPNEITVGHTHLFLLNNQEKNMYWGSEASLKINLCKKLAEGRNRMAIRPQNKILHLLFGETDSFMSELQLAVLSNHPILVIRGSQLCNEYFVNQSRLNAVYSEPSFGPLVKKGHFFGLNSTDSEDVAQYVHFLLTVTPY